MKRCSARAGRPWSYDGGFRTQSVTAGPATERDLKAQSRSLFVERVVDRPAGTICAFSAFHAQPSSSWVARHITAQLVGLAMFRQRVRAKGRLAVAPKCVSAHAFYLRNADFDSHWGAYGGPAGQRQFQHWHGLASDVSRYATSPLQRPWLRIRLAVLETWRVR